MRRPNKDDSILFMLEGSPRRAAVRKLAPDPDSAPHGVIIEMVSSKPIKEGSQCWIVSLSEKISGTIKHVQQEAGAYKFDMVLTINDPEFWK